MEGYEAGEGRCMSQVLQRRLSGWTGQAGGISVGAWGKGTALETGEEGKARGTEEMGIHRWRGFGAEERCNGVG